MQRSMKEEKHVLTSARQDADRLRTQNGLLESQLGRAWQQLADERTASELLRKQLAKQKEELDSVKEAGRSICMLAPEGYLLSITVSLALYLLSCLRLSLLSLCLCLLGPLTVCRASLLRFSVSLSIILYRFFGFFQDPSAVIASRLGFQLSLSGSPFSALLARMILPRWHMAWHL